MGNIFSTRAGALSFGILISLAIIGLIVFFAISNIIEWNTALGGIIFTLLFFYLLVAGSRGRTLAIGYTSQDAVKFAIRELNKILDTTPSAIDEISRRSVRQVLGGGNGLY